MKKILFILFIFLTTKAFAQTEMDGLLMDKNLFCVGSTYSKTNWKNYWEGTLKKDNLNLGKVSSSNVMINGNYGITSKLNAIFTLPYIKTKASAGQLAGQKGLQDFSLYLKWVGYSKQFKKSILKGIIVGGMSAPLSNYTPDILPLSIGLHSKTASIRAMVDFQQHNWFSTASGTYIYRGNVKLDRNTYYTTELHYSNMVQMPNATNINIRGGYRSETWIIEAIANKWITNGGFDISKNNIPFVSNKMNATTLGLHIKYETNFVNGLSFVADGMTTIAGRNIGQTSGFTVGAFYIMDFTKKKKDNKANAKQK
jgi:hypothetical protein